MSDVSLQPRPTPPRGVTLVLSLLAHGALIVLASRAPQVDLREPSPLRLSGTSFDISLAEELPAAPAVEVRPAPVAATPVAPAPVGPAPGPPPPVAAAPAPPEPTSPPPTPAATPRAPTPSRPAPSAPPPDRAPDSSAPTRQDSPAAPPATDARSPASGRAPAGSYGEEEAPAGRIDLLGKFLQTLPLAAKSDERWLSLPLGPAGQVTVVLTLDAQGRLQPIDVTPEPGQQIPAHLRRAALLNRNFLLHGRFALGQDAGASGRQRLRLSAYISQKPAHPDRPEDLEVQRFGRLNPELTPDAPTGVFFTYYTGRHIEILVERLPPSP